MNLHMVVITSHYHIARFQKLKKNSNKLQSHSNARKKVVCCFHQKMVVQTSCPIPSPLWSIENSVFSGPSNSSFSTTSCTAQGLKLDGGLQRLGRSQNLEEKKTGWNTGWNILFMFRGSMLKYVYMFLGFHAYGIFWIFSNIVNQIERWWNNVEPPVQKVLEASSVVAIPPEGWS